MTNDEAKALGLRALAAGFRWGPGCLGWWADPDGWVGGVRVRVLAVADADDDDPFEPVTVVVDGDHFHDCDGWWQDVESDDGPPNGAMVWPDFRDDATLGVLRARVREVWGDPRLCTVYTAPEEDDNDWSAVLLDYDDDFNLHGVEHVGIGRHEPEALVCALEAALEAGQGGEG